ncbi:hypothetical protein KJ596_03445 [Patescibacteria group bacterium]|nr:hypothetical protein [Patescibacteria group bacterium]
MERKLVQEVVSAVTRGSAVWIYGGYYIGKSHLLQDVASRLREMDYHVHFLEDSGRLGLYINAIVVDGFDPLDVAKVRVVEKAIAANVPVIVATRRRPSFYDVPVLAGNFQEFRLGLLEADEVDPYIVEAAREALLDLGQCSLTQGEILQMAGPHPWLLYYLMDDLDTGVVAEPERFLDPALYGQWNALNDKERSALVRLARGRRVGPTALYDLQVAGLATDAGELLCERLRVFVLRQ